MCRRHTIPREVLVSFILLALFCLSPNLAWLAVATADARPVVEGLLPAILGLALLVFLSTRVWPAMLILALLAPVSLAEVWYVIQFGKPTDAALFGVLLESNSAELLGFISGLWGYFLLATLLPLLVAVAVIRHLRDGLARWPARPRWLILGGSLSGLLLLNAEWLVPNLTASDVSAIEDPSCNNIFSQESLQERLTSYSSSWPTGLPVRVLSVLEDRNTLSQARSKLESFRFDAALKPGGARMDNEIIVLVIGESSRPDRWQIFGYNRETTPRLSSYRNLVVFRDVLSPWAWTRMSVPLIITRKPARERAPFFPEKSLVAAFGEAGFHTAWLSNHNFLGMHESPTSVYAQDANEVAFLNPASYKDNGTYDDVLIPKLARQLQSGNKKQFIVLHTMGSHFNYNHRYPVAFERFTPSRPQSGPLSLHDQSQSELASNAYDNSILFTDHVLGEVISLLSGAGRPAALLYVADHGENLFADGCGLSGHGQETERDFRIPMVLWWSDDFAKKRPEKIKHAHQNAVKPVSTEVVFQSLLDLADISFPDEDLSRSVFSERFDTRPRWVYASGGVYFDSATVDHGCNLAATARP